MLDRFPGGVSPSSEPQGGVPRVDATVALDLVESAGKVLAIAPGTDVHPRVGNYPARSGLTFRPIIPGVGPVRVSQYAGRGSRSPTAPA